MGGGASVPAERPTSFSRGDKKVNIRSRNQLVRNVEKFVLSVYSSCPRTDAMRLLLWTTGGEKAFMSFVENEHADEYLTLFYETNKVRRVKNATVFVLRKYVETIVNDYIKPEAPYQIQINGALKQTMMDLLTDKIQNHTNPGLYVIEVIENLQIEMVNLMARDQLNRFLFSRFYKNWRANERGRAVASNSYTMATEIQKFIELHPNESSRAVIKRQPPTKAVMQSNPVVIPEDSLRSAFAAVDPAELGKILDYRSWISPLIASAEILPIALTISKGHPKKSNFPILYANKYFETLTGFSRTSVIGWSFKDFLHCGDTEKQKTTALVETLRTNSPVVQVMVHAKASGDKFNNLMALKPVLNEKGTFAYLIGLHIEVNMSETGDLESKTVIASQLLELIPGEIIMEKNEADSPGWLESWIDSFTNFASVVPGDTSEKGRSSGNSTKEGNVRTTSGTAMRSRPRSASVSGPISAMARR